MKSSSERSLLGTDELLVWPLKKRFLVALIGALFVFLIWGRYRHDSPGHYRADTIAAHFQGS